MEFVMSVDIKDQHQVSSSRAGAKSRVPDFIALPFIVIFLVIFAMMRPEIFAPDE